MKNNSNEKMIKSILLAIGKNLVQNREEINKNIENSLHSRLEKSNYDDNKYINLLKSNAILYKSIIREKEKLINTWITRGEIPAKETRREIVENLTKKCRVYVQEGMSSRGKTLSKLDVKNLLSYQNIEKDELKKRLEIEYKTFNIYNDVLNIFINSLKDNFIKELSEEDNNEVIKLIRVEMKKVTNFILKSFEKSSIEKVEEDITLEVKEQGCENSLQDEVEDPKAEEAQVEETIETEIRNEEETFSDEESISHEEEGISEKVKNKGSKKKGIVVGLVVAGICICIVALYMSGNINKGNSSKQPIHKEKNDESNSVLNSNPNEYIVEDSDLRYLTVSELEKYTDEELGYIRNEIFARYGYVFENDDYSQYFSNKNWYSPDDTFDGDEGYFNDYEKANTKLIKSLGASRSGKVEKSLTEHYYASEESKEIYKVYAGTYEEEAGAQEYIKALELQKIKGQYEQEEYIYKVMIGNSNSLKQAEEISKKMKEFSIDTYVVADNKEYEDQIERLRYLAEDGQYDEFKTGLINLKKKVENNSIYIKYQKELKELFDEYEFCL